MYINNFLVFCCSGKVSEKGLRYAWERLTHFAWGDNAGETADMSEEIEKMLDERLNYLDINGPTGPLPLDYFSQNVQRFVNVTPTEQVGLSNFIAAFKDHLDYIFVSENLINSQIRDCISLAPMLPVDILEQETALPSSVIPSDHVSLVVDISLV